MATRNAVHEYPSAEAHHMKAYVHLKRLDVNLNVHIVDVCGWSDWHQEARRLETTGKAILAYPDTYGANLDHLAARVGRGQ
ncbi:MAG: hypothetical protein OXF56_27190 [Rhodobacteraceae bacterium]|nr:hypothetical protein [Paracoccaceae bacterium]